MPSSPEPDIYIKGPVYHLKDGFPIRYPNTDSTPRPMPFDCLFTGRGEWIYVNSVQTLDDPRLPKQWKVVEERNQYWAIVEAETGKVVRACDALYRDAKGLKLAMQN